MNLNNYTIKSQEAIQQAVQLTAANGQQAIEAGHLLKAILEEDGNTSGFLLKKMGVNPAAEAQTTPANNTTTPKKQP